MSRTRFSRPQGRKRNARRPYRPSFELLESRLAPAVIQVTTTADEVDPSDGLTSLREAINQANADPPGDTIILPAGTFTITIPNASGPEDANASGSFDIGQSMTILGAGADSTVIDGNGRVIGDRVFQILGGADVQFGRDSATGLTIAHGASNGNGGGICTNGGAVTLISSTVTGNFANDSGGGICTSGGAVTVTNSTVSGNVADNADGGGIAGGAVTLTNSTVSGNYGDSHGGGVAGTAVTLNASTVSGNMNFGGDGGIFASGGAVTLTDSTVSGNSSETGTAGIGAFGPVTLTNSTVSGNTSQVGDGGIAGGAVTLVNSTVSGNTGAFPMGIGGIDAGGLLQLTNVTITGNTSGIFGAAVRSSGGATLTNTIVAGNDGPDLSGAFTSGGHNLIGDATGSTGFADGVNFDRVGPRNGFPIDPKLGPLQDNGGPTFTRALLAGSPAIDAGDNAGAVGPDGVPLTTDQRGFARVSGAAVDIGAFEVQDFVVTTTADAGPGSLRDAITNADLAGGSTITFAPGVAGIITLHRALPDLFRSVQLLGPGADVVTVRRSTDLGTLAFRLFTVDGPQGGIVDVTVTLAGLALANGRVTDILETGSGGAVSNAGTLTVADCALTGNLASDGGGIYNQGTLTLTGSTLSENSALSGFGGAIDNALFGRLALSNCTIAGNSAAVGGGIENEVLAAVTLTNCTVAGNSAASIGGGITNAGRLTAANTIIAGNAAPTGPDVFGALTSLGHNLVGNTSGGSGYDPSDLMGTAASPLDPLLAPLGSYGGPTLTMALRPGSPARDAGNTALAVDGSGRPLASDQRGLARVVDAAVDVGAFEVQDLAIDLNPGENVRLQRDAALPGLLDVVFSNSPRPGFTIDTATVSHITINGSLDNEVDLEDVPAGIAVTFNGKGGVQTVDVTPTGRDLGHIQGPVTVTSGSDPVTLTVNDQAGRVGRSYTLGAASLAWGGPAAIQFDHLGSLTLNTTAFNDTVTVQGLPPNPVRLDGGGGSNTLIGPDTANQWLLAQPSGHEGTLNGSLVFDSFGQLTGGQGVDRFVVPDGASVLESLSGGDGLHGGGNNTLDLSACTGPLTEHLFTSVYGGNVTTLSGGTVSTVVRAFALCQNVVGGQNDDRFVFDQGFGLATVDGGPGNNTIDDSGYSRVPPGWVLQILGHNSGLIAGQITSFRNIQNLIGTQADDVFAFRGTAALDGAIDGGGGRNTLNYLQSAASVSVNLQTGAASYVNLRGGSVPQPGGIANVQNFIGGPGSGNALTGPNTASTWNITGTGSGRINGSAFTFTGFQVLVGGTAANTLVGADTPNTWTVTGPNGGTVAGFAFSGFQALTGGAAADTFVFQPGGSLSAGVDGGGGTNALDYSHYVGDVTVDLALNLASLVSRGAAGSVFHIANVTGSIGNDLLVGDANANVLIGGTGRNILIGGGGADRITGGGGDNVLIGGTTSYDQDLTVLDAIFAEWTSADPLGVRMRDIRDGGGLNGGYILNPTASRNRAATVFDDGAPDLLYDGSGLSWFFVHRPDDRINDGAGPLASGDAVTRIP